MTRALTCFLLFTLMNLPRPQAQTRLQFLLGRGQIDIQDWTYGDFVKNNVTAMEAYTFLADDDGNPKKDSVRLFKKEFVKDSLMVTGSQCDVAFTSNGYFYPVRDSGKKYFDPSGLLIKTVRTHRDSLEYGKKFLSLSIQVFVTEYTYNAQRLPVREKTSIQTESYWIRINKDTTINKHGKTAVREHEYDEMGLRTRSYTITDSARTPASDRLDQKRLYDERCNTTLWITYTREGGLHTKHYYTYDTQNRLTLQVDSTGWFYTTTGAPYEDKRETYRYTDSLTTVITRTGHWTKDTSITILKKNAEGKLRESCTVYDNNGNEFCTYNTFKDGRLISQTTASKYGTDVHTYTYYPNGLLYEEKVTDNGKLTGLVRYVYR